MKLILSPAWPAALALCLCTLPALAAGRKPAPPDPVAAAVQKVDADGVLEHITVLSSDEFEGRAPGTPGEAVTVDYLLQQFKKLGLEPGNPDGTYVQQVPLVGVSSHPVLSYTAGGRNVPLTFLDDYVAWTARTEKKISIADSELVFVGYGVTAPEFNWDDYKGMDLRGKTLVMLINDPPLPDPKHPKQLDPAMFGGKAMTYYGRWTYKFEMAARLGAAAALIVHETKPASYPFDVVRNSWGRENFAIDSQGPNPDFPAVPGWLQLDKAKEIFKAGGQDFDALKKAALSRDFKPVPLGVTLTVEQQNSWRNVASRNVVARIPGSDPQLKGETILYSAHWDHFGIDDTLPGPRSQQIFHGALDNASGVAALLAVAKAYKALPVAPKRSIVFLLTTAEERGLLGAQYYARHPLYPLNKTLLDINMDGLNVFGRTRDVELSGLGKSTADDIVAAVAQTQGRSVRADSNPEFGSFYRGDQFEFAKVGVPVVYVRPGSDFIGKPRNYARDKVQAYVAHDYHKVSDVVQPGWDMDGALEDIALIFQVGYQVAQGSSYPQWKAGAEFKAIRDKSLAAPAK
jgi:Zn-dependent M28 family amino/carboxypeptidase